MNGATGILGFEVIKGFRIATPRTMSIAFRMTRYVRNCCRRTPHQYQLVFNLEAARKLDLSRALAQFPGDFLLRIELAPPPRQLVGAQKRDIVIVALP